MRIYDNMNINYILPQDQVFNLKYVVILTVLKTRMTGEKSKKICMVQELDLPPFVYL